jgi:radical SAM protein with 4Fe4S-binding SPASM domain
MSTGEVGGGLGSRLGVAGRLLPVSGWRALNNVRESRLHASLEAPIFREVNLEMTILCNLRCPFCWWWGTNGVAPKIIRDKEPLWKNQLTFEEIRKVFSPLKGKGVHFYLSGGEPFERPDAVEIIEFLSSLGSTISFTTNGTLLTDEIIQRLVKVEGITIMHFSLDGPEEIHDSIRGKGNFKTTIANARKILAARQGDHPKVWANSVMTNAMFGRTLDFVRTVEAAGFDRHVFQHLWFADRATLDRHRKALQEDFAVVDTAAEGHLMELPGAEYGRRAVQELERVRRAVYPFQMWTAPRLSVEEGARYYSDMNFSVVRSCGKPWAGVNVKADGSVNFCPDQWISYSVGNVRDAPLLELWNNEAAKRFRGKLNDRGLWPGCVHCCAINWRQQ